MRFLKMLILPVINEVTVTAGGTTTVTKSPLYDAALANLFWLGNESQFEPTHRADGYDNDHLFMFIGFGVLILYWTLAKTEKYQLGFCQ